MYNVVEQVMLYMVQKDAVGEALDDSLAIFDAAPGANLTSKMLLTSFTSDASFVTYLTRETDMSIYEISRFSHSQ